MPAVPIFSWKWGISPIPVYLSSCHNEPLLCQKITTYQLMKVPRTERKAVLCQYHGQVQIVPLGLTLA